MVRLNERGFVYDDSPQPMWLPPINLKQFEVFQCFKRYPLVHGPRKSSKTWGIIHKVIRHCFDLDGAMFAIVCKTIKNAKASGVWTLLCNVMLPFWERGIPTGKWEPWMPPMWQVGCPGFEVVEGPKTTGDTKMSFVKIRNRHGTVSEIQCHSLEHDNEVQAKFKGPAYSGFWLSEFDQYMKSRDAFDIFCDALRMPGIPYDQHQIICDCNPPESGPNNWMHDLWFKSVDNPTTDETSAEKRLREHLQRILIMIEDNPQLDPMEKEDLYARYRKRASLFNRFCLGKWEEDVTDGFFSDVYDEGVHIIGKVDGPPETHEVAVPTARCRVLLRGWDAGLSKNHSFHILEKIMSEHEGRQFVQFCVLDEVVIIREKISLTEFTLMCLERVDVWNKYMLKNHNIQLQWRDWSDADALDFRAQAGKSYAGTIYEASNGRMSLQAAPKYKNSKKDRVDLIWQLLHAQRLHISAQLQRTRAMVVNLKAGTGTDYIKKGDHVHPFDSMSYPIIAEAPLDMIKSAELTTSNNPRAGIVVAGV